jgi:NADH-quinone oxidoreductase subunit N
MALTSAAVDNLSFVLFFFLCAYALVLFVLGLGLLLSETHFATYLVELLQCLRTAEQRWALVASVLAFAGLPPFLLFFAKLSLLGLLASHGFWYAVLAALGLILLGWYLYSAVSVQLLNTPVRPRALRRQPRSASI